MADRYDSPLGPTVERVCVAALDTSEKQAHLLPPCQIVN